MALVESSRDELVALVGGLSSVRMDDYAVVGSYMRFGERVREQLKDARLRIAEACAQPAKRRDNHLLWAAPGSGKTYFVEQVAASLPEVAYVELNLAKLTEAGFREGLAAAIAGGPTICLIDEVDAKSGEPWPCEALMPVLDVNLERGGGIVFVLAGSSGSTIEEFKARIRARPKGTDVLSRVPEANGWEIAPMDAGDRILVALSQMLNAAGELDRSVAAVEKLALHYLAAAPHLANARQLREFAVRAVERGSASSDRIRYDDLFDSGDPENKRYWASVMPDAEPLVNSFVHIGEDGTRPRGPTGMRTPLALPDKPSIAVLPFTNLTGDPDQDYFADGIVEDIITGLSRIKWIFVIARNSSFAYKGKATDVKEVGRQLGIRYVLEGSVRKSADRVRIAAQLIDASSGTHIWADRYDRALDDIFRVQDEITISVVGVIEPTLRQAEIERAKRKRPDSLDAYDLYLRALPLAFTAMPENADRALALLGQAIELEPDYAAAHATVAWCHEQRYLRGGLEEEAKRAAIHHARRAIADGADDAAALATAAFVLAVVESDFETATDAFARSFALSPSSALALGFSSIVRAWNGDAATAVEHAERSIRLSPLDPLLYLPYVGLAYAHFGAGRFEDAAIAAGRASQSNPKFTMPHVLHAAALASLGREPEAMAEVDRLRELDPQLTVGAATRSARYVDAAKIAELGDALRRAGLAG